MRAVFGRRGAPLALPFRAVQRREDGPVVVPGHLRGRARTGRATFAGDGAAAHGLVGSHRAVHVAGLRLVLDPARSPLGWLRTLMAPAPEPGYGFRP